MEIQFENHLIRFTLTHTPYLSKDELINNRDQIIYTLKQLIAIYESDSRKEQLKNDKPKQQSLFKNSKLIFNKYNTMEPNEIGLEVIRTFFEFFSK